MIQKQLNPDNLLAKRYPEIAQMYDTSKNSVPLDQVTVGMHMKAWFVCPKCKKDFYCKIQSMFTNAEHCPDCRRKRLVKTVPGHTISDNPKMMLDWDFDNNDYSPEQLGEQSNRVLRWKCHKCGFSYKKAANQQFKHACPSCGHKKMGETKRVKYAVLNGSLAEKRPDLLKEWDFQKNTLSPYEVCEKSNRFAWWTCNAGHSYYSSIVNRSNLERGCPYCSGQKILQGFNDLQTKFPSIASRWDYVKNSPVTPDQVMPGTHKKYYWVCGQGHSYLSSVANLTSGVTKGCPYCAGQKVLKGFNDLETLYPDIAKEWDVEKNNKNADETTCGSTKSYFWKCPKGHSYQARIIHRIIGCNCPQCSKHGTSIPEYIIMYYLDSHKIQYVHRYKTSWLKRSEVDFFFPQQQLALEYDGSLWHKNAERDEKKNRLCLAHGITMMRFREAGLPKVNDCECIEVPYLGSHIMYYQALELPIIYLLQKLQTSQIDVNIKRDIQMILQTYRI